MATAPVLYWYQLNTGTYAPEYYHQLDTCVRALCSENSVTAPAANWYNSFTGTLTSAWRSQIDTAVRALCVILTVTLPVEPVLNLTYGQLSPKYEADLDACVRLLCAASGGGITLSFSTARASVGYADTVAGVLTSFLANTPRVTTKGTLVEAGITNLVTQSQTLNSWTKTNITVTADQIAAPDGTTTADMLTDSVTNAQHTLSMPSANLSVTSGTMYTGSVYAKAGTYNLLQLCFSSTGFGAAGYVDFDLTNGVISSSSGVNASSGVGMEVLANGWYRCWINEVSDGTSSGANFIINMAASLTATKQQSYIGSGSTLYLWGAQVEASTTTGAPTSYVATVGATAARSTDIVTSMTAGVSTGSIVLPVCYSFYLAGTQVLCQWDDGTEDNRIRLAKVSSTLHYIVTVGGVDQCDISLGTIQNGIAFKVACAWGVNDFAASLNGTTVSTDVSGTIPTGLTTLRMGSDSAGNNLWNGYIGTVSAYSTRKTNSNLQTLSRYPVVTSPRSQLIVDLDIDSDIDDVGDLLTMLAMDKARECDINCFFVTSANTAAVGCLYAILNYYGRTSIPIGVSNNTLGTSSSLYDAEVVSSYGVTGHVQFSQFSSSITIGRTALVAAADHSVSWIITGGAGSLYDVLNSPADGISALTGLELVALKVNYIFIVAGGWPSGAAVSDMSLDRINYQWIMDHCTAPIFFQDVLGTGPNYLGVTFEALSSINPARFAWETYWTPSDPSTSNRQSWSGPSILSMVRGLANYQYLGGQFGGGVVNQGTGATTYRPEAGKNQGYLVNVLSNAGMQTIINALILSGGL